MWNSIIKDEALKDLIKQKLKQIFESLKNIDDDNCSLVSGQPGIILFKSYYFRLNPAESIDYDWRVQFLYNYFDNPSSLSYSRGMSGVLHTLQHLEEEGFFDFGNDIKEFDYSVFDEYILNEPTLDYLHGNTGVILNLLGSSHKNSHEKRFNYWLTSIKKIKEVSEFELKWKIDFFYPDKVEKGYSLGLAHGIPSIILILLKLYKKKESNVALTYIKQGIEFLLNNKLEDNSEFYFPTRIINNVKLKGRLAWCYGDLGVALALYEYGTQFADMQMYNLAIEIFKKHTLKHDFEYYDVDDADFCHGSVGIAHVYARMYNYSGIEEFRETAEYWYSVTIKKAIYTDGIAGYKHSRGKDQMPINEYGLLEGVSGIGLSLMSAISNVEPKWDNTFLLS